MHFVYSFEIKNKYIFTHVILKYRNNLDVKIIHKRGCDCEPVITKERIIYQYDVMEIEYDQYEYTCRPTLKWKQLFQRETGNAGMVNGGREVSVWSGSNIVARRVVVACHKCVTAVTFDLRASNFTGCSPHNLSVVGAVLSRAATIICIVIQLLLINPCSNCLPTAPTSAAPPEYVLAKRAIRMLEEAISPSFPSTTMCIIRKLHIPVGGHPLASLPHSEEPGILQSFH